ncbi:hypothetical protein VNI00_010924 [Paramarasmius palmivorus]|uniref:Uncharacterized protein n=1 Tax=Paramarasmius palmivorus TaxID=297713 RepID=A0AAW0CF30_9AGAR
MNSLYIPLLLARLGLALRVLSYEPLREYAGKDFFSGWDINGSSSSITQHSGTHHDLILVNHSNGHAIIRIDNTTKIDSVHHNSRSVQPSFSLGELDLMGKIQNQFNMAQWQTDYVQQPEPQSPKTLKGSTASDGCGESIAREAGEGDGGVFALQIDVERVLMWSWSRQDIPFSISQTKFREGMNLNLSDWQKPSAIYPAAGHVPMRLALGVTLCGDQAGEPEAYTETCPGPQSGECTPNNSTSAYWEISYIRTFTLTAASRKPELLARSGSDTNTSSIDLLPPSTIFTVMRPPHPSLFNPTTVRATATLDSDDEGTSETDSTSVFHGSFSIFNPVITPTATETKTETSAYATYSIFDPASTSEAGPTAEVASTVVDVTLGGSVRSITLTVGEDGVGVVGATTAVNSVGFGVSGSASSQTDAIPPSGSPASSNAGTLTRFSVNLLVVGFVLSALAVDCCI